MNRYSKKALFILGTVTTLAMLPMTAKAADYMVTQNDSLYKIGVLFNTPISTLKSANSLSTDEIYPGQKLSIDSEIYTVKTGDTLFLIAKKYRIALTSLRKANAKWDDQIIPGQKLILPGKKLATKTVSETATTVIPYTQNELDLLSRLITAEAGGESYDAMVGVGAVVVNRVQSTVWPNTISTVINHVAGGYQQFTPVKNGYINNPATDIAIKAAKAALYGSDPSKEAMFYFDDSSTNQWLWSKTRTAYIDNMVFVK